MVPHQDKLNQHTYSIKIGKSIPPNSVNLGYIESDPLESDTCLEIRTTSEQKASYTEEIIGQPDRDFVLHSEINGNPYLASQDVIVTDEFSIKWKATDTIVPLYYVAHLQYPIETTLYGMCNKPGYTTATADEIIRTSKSDGIDLVYLGTLVTIYKNNEVVDRSLYKIVVTATDNGYGHVSVYTSFAGDKDTIYTISYPGHSEVLLCYPFYIRDDDTVNALINTTDHGSNWDPALDQRIYSIEEDLKYKIRVPSHLLIADKDTRPAEKFRYKLDAHLNVRYGADNPCTINIGLLFVNTRPDAEDVSDILKKLYNHTYLPSYITLQNPHQSYGYIDADKYINPKDNPNYWIINLDSPEEFIDDYDVIFVCGYGYYDMSKYNYVLKRFLENGGCLWIDNLDNNVSAFNPGEFIANIWFNPNVNEDSPKEIVLNDESMTRVWTISDCGFKNVSSRIMFGPAEDPTLWETCVKYTNGSPCVIRRSAYKKGTIYVSNCGIMHAVHASEGDDIKLAINIILSSYEDMWIHTPWLHDSVLYIDNVFELEYGTTPNTYQIDYNPIDTTSKIAKKMLYSNALECIDKYKNIYGDILNGTYDITIEQLEEQNGLTEYVPSERVFATGHNIYDPVCVYTTYKMANAFNITSEYLQDGYYEIYYDDIDLVFTIYSFVYEWDGQAYRKKYSPEYKTYNKTISKTNGVVDCGFLQELIPPMDSRLSYDSIYFEVSMSYVDQNGYMHMIDIPADVEVYDQSTGEYIYDIYGNVIIPYEDLFYYEKWKYLKVYAWTNYQTIAVTRKRFAAKATVNTPIYAMVPQLGENQPWYLPIKNGSFREIEIAEEDKTRTEFLYEIPEYYRQAYSPRYPYAKIENEKPTYIDYYTIKCKHGNLYIDRGSVHGEQCKKITEDAYQLQHWPVNTVSVYDDSGPIIAYDVDAEHGVIRVMQQVIGTLHADYEYNNLHVIRRKYGRQASYMEKLTKLDSNSYMTSKHPIAKYPAPVVYINNERLHTGYTFDYETGILNLVNNTDGNVYATYSYYQDTELTIKDFDTISGTLFMQDRIEFTDEIYVSYYYKKDFYELPLDLNPSEGHMCGDRPGIQLVNSPVYIYMLPKETDIMYYCKVPDDLLDGLNVVLPDTPSMWDDIINPTDLKLDQTSYIPYQFIDAVRINGDISSDPVNIYNRARAEQTHVYADSNMGLIPLVVYQTDSGKIVGGHLMHINTIKYTYDISDLNLVPGSKLLATVSVKLPQLNTIFLDGRKRGGGIKDTIQNVQERNKELNVSYWDVSTWNGIAYPKYSSIVIHIQRDVLSEFTKEEINQYIEQFLPLGVYYIVEFD